MGNKVLFLNPPIWDLVGVNYKMNQPLGGPIITTILSNSGFDARYTDAEYYAWSVNDLRDYIRTQAFDIICITLLTVGVSGAKRAIDIIREVSPGAYVAVGGPHATAIPHQTYELLKPNLLVIGECEKNIEHLIGSRATGIRDGVMEENIDDIPMPDFYLCDPKPTAYLGNSPKYGSPEVLGFWNRGCMGKCIFCSNPCFQGKLVRFHSPERICLQSKQMRDEWGAKGMFVYSDELIGESFKQTRWLKEVCNEIIRRGVILDYKTQGRVNAKVIDLEVLQLMKKAGFKGIMWGIESGSQKILDVYKKGITLDDIWYTLRLSKEAGLENWLFFMVGAPYETEKEVMETLDLIVGLKKEGLLQHKQVSVVTPQPGSELWDMAIKNKWMSPDEMDVSKRWQFTPQMNLPWMTKEDIVYWRKRLEVM